MTRRRLRTLGLWGGLLLVMAFTLLPYAWLVISSFKPSVEIFTQTPSWRIHEFSWRNYQWALGPTGADLGVYFWNTIVAAGSTAILTAILASMAGYAMARYAFPGRRILAMALLLSPMFQGPPVMIPFYRILSALRLLNTIPGLVLVYLSLTLPICIWLMAGFFRGLPRELEEAALVDGCGPYRAFVRILLPLTLPGLAATSLFAFVVAWNDYQYALILTSSTNAKTIQMGLAELMTFFGQTNWGGIMASGVLATLPVVLIFMFIQRALVQGITAGALKS
jgi:ABC-type glycerol-3-phosphate transport system permease component